jgi:glycosyltransferase 2 family protein
LNDPLAPGPTAAATTPERKRRRVILFVAKLALSVTLLIVLFSHLGSAAVLDAFSRTSWWVLVFAVFALTAQSALSTLKWLLLLRQQGVASIRYLQLLKVYLKGDFINLFMPSFVVGDAYRATQLRKHTGTLHSALPSIIVDRGSGLGALVFLGAIGLLVRLAPQHLVAGTLVLLAAAVAGYLLLIGAVARLAASTRPTALFGVPGILAQSIGALRPSPTFFCIVALSFVFQFNTIVINFVYCLGLNIPVSFMQLMSIVPAVYLLEVLPISINGIGARESAFAVLFAQIGLEPAHGVALGLTISATRYIAGLVGGIVLATEAIRNRSSSG